jgi:ribosome maturation protein SDO1
MADTVARIKVKGKTYEIMVDCDKAIALKKQGKINAAAMSSVLSIDEVFTHYQKGIKAPESELRDAFRTIDVYEIAAKILADGELQLPQEYRDKERDAKLKQIIDFLARNCINPRTNTPYTPEMISTALKQVGAKIDETRSADEQAMNIIKDLLPVMPIKIETKRIRLTIPAIHTGKVYGLLQKFKLEKEDWLADGSLQCIIDLPAGMQLEFYDKLNAITHGETTSEEIKQ